VPDQRLVFTDALLPGFRPAPAPFFTAVVEMSDSGTCTGYVATAMHRDHEGRAKHEAMGFAEGWGSALDQLVAHMKAVQAGADASAIGSRAARGDDARARVSAAPPPPPRSAAPPR
jgi:hypothetical protein